jgi:hypothetical protein
VMAVGLRSATRPDLGWITAGLHRNVLSEFWKSKTIYMKISQEIEATALKKKLYFYSLEVLIVIFTCYSLLTGLSGVDALAPPRWSTDPVLGITSAGIAVKASSCMIPVEARLHRRHTFRADHGML